MSSLWWGSSLLGFSFPPSTASKYPATTFMVDSTPLDFCSFEPCTENKKLIVMLLFTCLGHSQRLWASAADFDHHSIRNVKRLEEGETRVRFGNAEGCIGPEGDGSWRMSLSYQVKHGCSLAQKLQALQEQRDGLRHTLRHYLTRSFGIDQKTVQECIEKLREVCESRDVVARLVTNTVRVCVVISPGVWTHVHSDPEANEYYVLLVPCGQDLKRERTFDAIETSARVEHGHFPAGDCLQY